MYSKYTINDRWLDKIDSEKKTYFLGLMWADGNLADTNGYRVVLSLQERDRAVLDTISNILYGQSIVKIQKPKNKKWQNMCRLIICNKHLFKRIEKLGCGPRKTFILKFPEWINPKLVKHFIRGLIDGDGCIYIRKDGNTNVEFTGTIEVIYSIFEIIKSELDIKTPRLYKRFKDKKDNIFSFKITNFSDNKKFLDWIYKDSNIFIDRKYEKYLEFNRIYQDKLSSGKISERV